MRAKFGKVEAKIKMNLAVTKKSFVTHSAALIRGMACVTFDIA